jgi:hypothetical protein
MEKRKTNRLPGVIPSRFWIVLGMLITTFSYSQ